MSETVTQPPPPADNPINLRREASRPPDTGRSLTSALAEMQRRRVATGAPLQAPVAQAVVPAQEGQSATTPWAWQPPAVTGAAPAPALPPPDATMDAPPASQGTGRGTGDMVVQVMIDGQPTSMTLGELQAGYMRGRDYTIKTKQLTESTRLAQENSQRQLSQAQEAQRQFANARQLMEQRLPQFLAERQAEFAQPIDWEKLSREDPIGTGQKVARLLALQQALAEQQALAQIRQNEEDQRKRELHRVGHDVLSRLIPGWSDDATRRVIQQALRSFAISMGYPAEQVDQAELLDPRDLYMAWKAMNYDRLMAARVTPQPVGAPVHTGGSSQRRVGEQASLTELDDRFRQTGRIDDALAVMQARAALAGREPVVPPRANGRYR